MLFRRPQIRHLRFSLLCACAALLAACNTVQGKEVGTYQVEMRLEENTCGPEALYTEDGKHYRVQLRAEGATGYWRVAGEKPLQGSYDAGRFKFTYESVVASSPDDAATFCQLAQSELLSGAVALYPDAGAGDAGLQDAGVSVAGDAGAPPVSGLQAELVYTISPVSGTDCSDALPPIGKYQKLPCEVRYKLIGTPIESF
jgi:hypothetical protein